jgi:hypothetical protein
MHPLNNVVVMISTSTAEQLSSADCGILWIAAEEGRVL